MLPGPAPIVGSNPLGTFYGEVARVQATFDLAGLYVWHCHIVEHEDNEMMRPFRVG